MSSSPCNQNQPPPPFDLHRLFPPIPSPQPQPITTHQNPNNNNNNNNNNLYPSTASYPTPNLIYHIPPPPFPIHQQPDLNLHSNPNHGARLLSFLTANNIPPQSSIHLPPLSTHNPAFQPLSSAPMRMSSGKLPKGRHLVGERLVYDIDVKLPGEVQPQLEVTPITKYGSHRNLVVGRQIAVNKSYICYGLKPGTIRVLNINTALRSLFKGLAQRVTDMAFFAEDVHLLASASMDGRVYVWKVVEDLDEDDKPQITGKIVIAVQIDGGEPVHPRVCWHCHKQEILVVGIGNHILRLDTTKVGRGKVYSADEPLICSVDKLIDGIQFVGKHDGEVTDLSMCQWMITRLVSASVDGTKGRMK